METDKLITELRRTTTDFIEAIQAFTDAQYNEVPFEGSWTGGQTAEHILKAESDLPDLLTSQTAPTSRPVDQYIPVLEDIFLDFNKKFKAAESITPSNGPHEKAPMIAAFEETRRKMIEIAEREDLTLTVTSFPFPQLAELTGWEWLNFVNFHCIRHTEQLRNILTKLNEKVASE